LCKFSDIVFDNMWRIAARLKDCCIVLYWPGGSTVYGEGLRSLITCSCSCLCS